MTFSCSHVKAEGEIFCLKKITKAKLLFWIFFNLRVFSYGILGGQKISCPGGQDNISCPGGQDNFSHSGSKLPMLKLKMV